MTPIPRREFLRTSLVAALAGPAVLAACRSGPPAAAPTASPTSLKHLIDQRRAAGAREGLQVFLGGGDYVAGIPNHVAFGIVTPGRDGVPVTGQDATVWIAEGAAGDQAPIGPFPAGWFPFAKPDTPASPQGANAVELTFPRPGVWQVFVDAPTPQGRTFGPTAIIVKSAEESAVPLPGQPAKATRTPTVDDARGVDPICTREDDDGNPDPCDFHAVTLARALDAGKPVVFYVGTPRFCESRTCGPILEELIVVARDAGDRATFVHAEVYVNDEPDTIARRITTDAFREWGFVSEPWVFLIDADGAVAARFEGPVAASQIAASLTPLLG